MGFLKLADISAKKRYTHEDGDWVEVRQFLTKAEMNSLFMATPDSMIEPTEHTNVVILKDSPQMAQALFGLMVVGWSLDVEASLDNYLKLDPDPANWVDGVLFGHLQAMAPDKEEQGKPTTSPRASRKVSGATT